MRTGSKARFTEKKSNSMRKTKPHPSQEELRRLYEYDGETVYRISDLDCIGGLRRKSGRTKRDHCFIGVKGNKLGYILAYVPGHTGLFSLHRLMWIFHNGDVPEGLEMDHKEKPVWDNRIQNLRPATTSQNQFNRKAKRKGAKGTNIGVIPHRKGWNAFSSYEGKTIFLGYFTNEQAAVQARADALKGRTL
jgi:hypothetical protein